MRVQEVSIPHGNVFNVTENNNRVHWQEKRVSEDIDGGFTTTVFYRTAELTPAAYTNSGFVDHLEDVLNANTKFSAQKIYTWQGSYTPFGGLAGPVTSGNIVITVDTTVGHLKASFQPGSTYDIEHLTINNFEFDGNSVSGSFGTGTISADGQDILWSSGGYWRKLSGTIIPHTVVKATKYDIDVVSGDVAQAKLLVNTATTQYDFSGTWNISSSGDTAIFTATSSPSQGYNVMRQPNNQSLGFFSQNGHILTRTNNGTLFVWNGTGLLLPGGNIWTPVVNNVETVTESLAETQTNNEFRIPSLQELVLLQNNFIDFDEDRTFCDLISRLFGTTEFRSNIAEPEGRDSFTLSLMTDENVYYLHSDRLSSNDGMGVKGNTTMIARIPVENQEVIHYRSQADTIINVFPAGKSLATIDFSLRDVNGHLVDLRGKAMSLLLTFDV